jgi:hypothetical protein
VPNLQRVSSVVLLYALEKCKMSAEKRAFNERAGLIFSWGIYKDGIGGVWVPFPTIVGKRIRKQ